MLWCWSVAWVSFMSSQRKDAAMDVLQQGSRLVRFYWLPAPQQATVHSRPSV